MNPLRSGLRLASAGLLLAQAVYFGWWASVLAGVYRDLPGAGMLSRIVGYGGLALVFALVGLARIPPRWSPPRTSLLLLGLASLIYGAWGVLGAGAIVSDWRAAFAGDAVAREFLSGVGFLALGVILLAEGLLKPGVEAR